MKKNLLAITLLLLLTLLFAACQATVPQEEYDALAAELAATEAEAQDQAAEAQAAEAEAQAEIERLETELAEAQAEIDDLQSQETDVESELRDLQEKAAKAALSAEILDVMVRAVLGSEEMTDEEAVTLFLELSEKVGESDDTELQEKFQAVLFSFGGEAEGIELVEYLIETIGELDEEG